MAYAQSSGNGKKFALEVAVKADKTRAELAAGKLDDFMLKSGEIIIPETYVKQLGFKDAQSAIGQTITLGLRSAEQSGEVAKEMSLKITAVDKESDTILYYQPTLRISTADAKEIYEFSHDKSQPNEYSTALVSVDDEKNIDAVKDEISKDYSAYSIQDVRKTLLTMVNAAQAALAGFGGLALLASVFGIINTMYIWLDESAGDVRPRYWQVIPLRSGVGWFAGRLDWRRTGKFGDAAESSNYQCLKIRRWHESSSN